VKKLFLFSVAMATFLCLTITERAAYAYYIDLRGEPAQLGHILIDHDVLIPNEGYRNDWDEADNYCWGSWFTIVPESGDEATGLVDVRIYLKVRAQVELFLDNMSLINPPGWYLSF
jgi:hypothetical protein